MSEEILQYHQKQTANEKNICDALMKQICSALPEAEYKIWHSHPVWFLNGNPIVGYSKLKAGIQLLFWSGRSFEESNLKAEGKFQAAGIIFTSEQQIDAAELQIWLSKARSIQWDYKNIVKRKGKLERLV